MAATSSAVRRAGVGLGHTEDGRSKGDVADLESVVHEDLGRVQAVEVGRAGRSQSKGTPDSMAASGICSTVLIAART